MEKLICLDVDGTLVSGSLTIEPRVRHALEMCIGKKLIVSGRTTKELFELDVDYDMIGSNGGEIFKDYRMIQKLSIGYGVAKEVHDYLSLKKQICVIHTNNGRFINEQSKSLVRKVTDEIASTRTEDLIELEKISDFMFEHIYGKSIKVKDVLKHVITNGYVINKLETFFQGDKEVQMTEMKSLFETDIFCSAITNIEIVPKGANKGSAIARYVGTEKYTIFAVGDGDNDYEMLEHADVGIAMGNASEKLKSVADHIVGTYDEMGILEAFEIISNYQQ